MKHPVEQVGWVIIGLLLGGLMAYSVNVLGADPIVSEQTSFELSENKNPGNPGFFYCFNFRTGLLATQFTRPHSSFQFSFYAKERFKEPTPVCSFEEY